MSGKAVMAVQNWSDSVVGVSLENHPQFNQQVDELLAALEGNPSADVLLDFASVHYINSSNITRLLKLRERVTVNQNRRLVLCSVVTDVRDVMRISALDRNFAFAPDIRAGLDMVHLEPPG